MKKLLTLLLFVPFIASAVTLTPAQVVQYFKEQGNVPRPLSATEWLAKQTKPTERPKVDVSALAVDPSEYHLLNSLLLGAQNAVGGRVYTLSGSGISSSGTSLGLASFKVVGADIKLVMSDFGDLGCGTIEPGNATRQEFVSFTGVTQNSDGTATLTGLARGLSPVSPYTASTSQQRSHSGASQFVISNSPPCFYQNYANRTASTTVTAKWIFDVLPESSVSATTSNQFITLAQSQAQANQGAATSTESVGGISELGTLAEQAASYDGGANQPTVLQTKNSTSTCQVVGSYNIVASSTSGKLDKNCFDQTANYSLTGTIGVGTSTPVASFSVQGDSYLNGTTTMANVVLSSTTPIHANGTNIQIPANLGTVGSVLSYTRNATTGAGSMTGNATTTMGTVTLPANTLRSGSQLMMDMFGSVGSGSGCVFGIEFGGGQSTSSLGYVDGTLAHNLIATPHVGAISAKMNVTSATQQYTQSWSGNTSSQGTFGYATTSTFSVVSPLYIAFTGRDPNGNTTCSLAGSSVTIYGN